MRALFVLLLCAFGVACQGERGPNLVELTELGPRHVDVGDRVRLSGNGFPEGRPATVTLKGDLIRAGEAPRRGVALTVAARRVAPHALEFAFSPELARRLCGSPDARHTTFRGDVEVMFAAQSSLRGGVTGRLDGVVLDASPEPRAEAAAAMLAADGARFAEFLGVELGVSGQGLQVSAVAPGSRAARARVMPGDVLLELEGMVLQGMGDFIPPPNAKSALLQLRRGPDELPLRVDALGFRYSAPETLVPAIALIGGALALYLLLCSPFGRWLLFFERRFVERVRAQRTGSLGVRTALLRSVWGGLGELLPDSFMPYLALVGVSAYLALSAIGKSIVLSTLDLFALPAATLTALLLTALITGGAHARASLRDGAGRALSLLLLNLPLIVLGFTVAWWTGGVRPTEVAAAQGPWPWQWSAFTNPAVGLLALLATLALVPTARPAPALLAAPRAPTRRERALDLASWVHWLSTSGFLALVALGGQSLPWEAKSVASQAFGASLVLAKAWFLLALVGLMRSCLGGVDAALLRRPALLGFALPSLLALLLAASSPRFAAGPAAGALGHALPYAIFGALLLALLLVTRRVLKSSRAPVGESGVQPWL